MSLLFAAFKIYFEISGVLFAAGACFVGCRKFLDGFNVISQSFMTRLGQALMIGAFILPCTLACIPEQQLPVIRFEVFSGHGELMAKGASERSATPKLSDSREPIAPKIKRDAILSLKQRAIDFMDGARGNAFLILLGALLLLGWAVMLVRYNRQLRSLRSLLQRSLGVRSIGRTRVAVSDEISVPFSTLIDGKAFVLVPLAMATDHDDFKLAIFHEIQHHRCGDTLWARVTELAIVAFFWNPAVYLWKKEIIQVQELACDETLIGQRRVSLHKYGSCLLKVAEAALVNHHMQIGTVCMAVISKNPNRRTSFLRRRIDMFASHKNLERRNALGLALGTASFLLTAVVAYGAQQTFKATEQIAPNPGEISFDPDIQRMTETTLAKYVAKFKAKAGFVLVSETATGRLLAVANISDDPKAAKNWALSAEIEPASALKVPLIASALNVGSTTPDETHNCENGVYTFGNGTYHDWSNFNHLTTIQTVVKSSNICSIKIAQELGAEGVAKSFGDFGFGVGGTTTGFPQARAGQIPDAALYSAEDFEAMSAVGASASPKLHVTPLEMVQAIGAIANKGQLMKPLMANAQDSSIQILRQAVSEKTAEEMKAMLRLAVTCGTGVSANSKLYTTAGKTSSAYGPNAYDRERTPGERGMGGFVGFAPVDNPRVTVYVGMLEPTDAEDGNPHGNRHAAPVFKEVIEEVLQHMNVPPDQVPSK